MSQIVSGGWDGAVKLWDPRKPIGPISSHSQDNKVYAIAIAGERIIVGTANRKVREIIVSCLHGHIDETVVIYCLVHKLSCRVVYTRT